MGTLVSGEVEPSTPTSGPSLYIDLGEVQGTHLKATIPLSFDTEYIPRTQAQISTWFEELKPWLLEYLYEAGHIRYDGANEDEVLERAENGASLTYFVTDHKQVEPTSEEMKFLVMCNVTSILGDDFGEINSGDLDSAMEDASEFTKLVTRIAKGEYTSMDEIPMVYPALAQFIKAAYIIQEKGQKLFPDYASKCQYNIDVCVDSCAANAILSAELKQLDVDTEMMNGNLPHRTFGSLREADFGVLGIVEQTALAAGIHLDDSVRRNLLLRRLISVFESITANSNDIIGLKRDVANGGISAILYRTKSNPAWTLEQSFMYAVNEVKYKTAEFKVLAAKLRALGNKQLNQFIAVIETVIHGLMIWSLQTKKRYEFNEIKFL